MGSNGSESKLIVAGSVGLILAIAGVVLTQPHLKSSRPLEKPNVMQESVREKIVPARLWEDPLEAVQRAKDEKGIMVDPLYQPRVFDPIRSRIDADPGMRNYPVDILLVMTEGGPYAEGREDRIRDRYAIASALGVSCYVPADEEHLSYVKWQAGGIPRHLPYEWYRERKTRHCSLDGQRAERVLVLWVTSEILDEQPLQSLARLIASLCDDPYAGTKQCRARVGSSQVAHFKVIGPHSSSGLREWLEEAVRPQKPVWFTENGRIELYSPWATAMPSLLMSQLNGGSDPATIRCESPDQCKDRLKGILSNAGIDLKYSIGSDDQLLTALVEELQRRQVKFEQDAIVLIGEWDTYYGRALPVEFRAAACSHIALHKTRYDYIREEKIAKIEARCGSLQKAIDLQVDDQQGYEELKLNIWRYSYLRGLDGQVPGNKEGDTKPGGGRNEGEEKKKNVPLFDERLMERPVGPSQFDYTRRLADRITSETKRERAKVRAVGILGTDPYDALLILQALRDQFPTAIFFMTDLDARLVYSDEHRWTRNLVIASHFGSMLNNDLQRDVPPFRSGYQTSAFLATLRAVGHVRVPESCDRKADYGTCGYTANLSSYQFDDTEKPRLYEVGRYGAIDLSIGVPRIGYTSLHPSRLDLDGGSTMGSKPEPKQIGGALFLGLLAVVAGLARRHGTPRSVLASQLVVATLSIGLPIVLFLTLVQVVPDAQSWISWQGCLLSAACWALAAVILRVHPSSRQWMSQVRWLPGPLALRTAVCALFVILLDAGGITTVSLLADWCRRDHDQGEPFFWLQGVSIWPTEVIRVATALLALGLVRKGLQELALNTAEVNRRFGFAPPANECVKDSSWVFIKRIWRNTKDDYQLALRFLGHGDGMRIDESWSLYTRAGSSAGRVAGLLIIWALTMFAITLVLGGAEIHTPCRGQFSCVMDRIGLMAGVFLGSLLTAFALDTTILCALWIRTMSTSAAGWPHPTTDQEGHLDKVRLVAKRTEVVSRIIAYPPLVWLLIIVARNNYFDYWSFPPLLIAAWITNLFMALTPAFLLYWVGEKMRSQVLDDLNGELHKQLRWGKSAERHVVHTHEAINDVEHIRKGAFLPLWQQPFVQTLLYGVVALLQYLYLGT